MGFYSDWIEKAQESIDQMNSPRVKNVLSNVDRRIATLAMNELTTLNVQVKGLRRSRIIRMPGEQAQVFLDMPRVEGQDLTLLRAPYDFIYVEPFNSEFKFDTYWDNIDGKEYKDVVVKGVMVISVEGKHIDYSLSMPETELVRGFQVHLFVPLPGNENNTYIASFGVTSDGKLITPNYEQMLQKPLGIGKPVKEIAERVTTWTFHLMNYLTSPTVILEEHGPSEALQKARARRGKEPLPGWYEIQYTKSRIKYAPSEAPSQGSKHGFRYDVRGHFAHFKKGRLAGRVIWIPPHQRGIKNQLYKPKTYRTEGPKELPDVPELYRG